MRRALALLVLALATQASPFTLPDDDQALALAYTRDLAQPPPTANPSPSPDAAATALTPTTDAEQPRDPLADDDYDSQADIYTRAREIARLNIMDKILIALGPPFGEKLPKAPTNDTLATVPTPIQINSEPCPYKYKRCSSQTYFPSCDVPRNTDPEIWPQRFNLFFNLWREFNNKVDVMNATLRLYKNASLPLEVAKTTFITAYVYNKSLTRKRHRTRLVAETQISSDYIGWVTLPVETMVRRWRRRRNNHGLLITVNDVDDTPWDAPSIFVTMDCNSGLLPLPFEVQTEEEGQRYPALNVRLGSPEDEPGATPSPSPAPEDATTENVTQIQSDDPSLYDYDYTVPSNAIGLSSTPDTPVDNMDELLEELTPEVPLGHVPDTPESHLLYHAHNTNPVNGDLSPGNSEDDPVQLSLSSHNHHHAHPTHDAEINPVNIPLSLQPAHHSPTSMFPTPYLAAWPDQDDFEDDSQLASHPQIQTSPPTPSATTNHPDVSHILWAYGQPMTDEELVLASQRRPSLDQDETMERVLSEEDRILASEREQTSERRPNQERRPSQRERQRSTKERRHRRKHRGQRRRG